MSVIKDFKTDADIVRALLRMDQLLEKVRKIQMFIDNCDHPNAAAIAEALHTQCVVYAWPSHVGHDHLLQPDKYETGDFGIRRKKRETK